MEESATVQRDIDLVLDALYAERGLDFRLYRRSTIERRLSQRLAAVRAKDYADYVQLLANDPAEFGRLIAHLTLKVTGFFRNPPVFDLLRDNVLPKLLSERPDLSIWSAACATGEEPYSVAMLLTEMLALSDRPVSIMGTDIDEDALRKASIGAYSATAVGDVPAALLERSFVPISDEKGVSYVVRSYVRRLVRFARHNLVDPSDVLPVPPPFDLILCRNVLIYFQRTLQQDVVDLLHCSLREGGYLILGEAESLPVNLDPRYHCLDRRARVYRKISSDQPSGFLR